MRTITLILFTLLTFSVLAQNEAQTIVTYNMDEVEMVRGSEHHDHLEFKIKKIDTSTDIYFEAKAYGFDDSMDAANYLEKKFNELKSKYPNQRISFFVDKNRNLIPSDEPFKVQIGSERKISSEQDAIIEDLKKQLKEKEDRINELESQISIRIN